MTHVRKIGEWRQHGQRIAGYSAAAVLVAVLIGCLVLAAGQGRAVRTWGLVQQVAVLLTGGGHAWYWRKWLPFFQTGGRSISREGWWFSGLLAFGIGGCIALFYELAGKGGSLMALAAVCIFLAPLTILQSWYAYEVIPASRYKIWFNPQVLPAQPFLPAGKKFPLRIRMTRNYYDLQEEVIPTHTPLRMQLGRLFFHFILEQNQLGPEIQWLDKDGRSYGWEFYTHHAGGIIKRRLDPDLNLADNKIKYDDTILAKRVSQAEG